MSHGGTERGNLHVHPRQERRGKTVLDSLPEITVVKLWCQVAGNSGSDGDYIIFATHIA